MNDSLNVYIASSAASTTASFARISGGSRPSQTKSRNGSAYRSGGPTTVHEIRRQLATPRLVYAKLDLRFAHASGIIIASAYSAARGAARSMAPSVAYQAAYCAALAVPVTASSVLRHVSLERWYEVVETPRNRSTLWMSSRTPSPKRTFLTLVRLSICSSRNGEGDAGRGEHRASIEERPSGRVKKTQLRIRRGVAGARRGARVRARGSSARVRRTHRTLLRRRRRGREDAAVAGRRDGDDGVGLQDGPRRVERGVPDAALAVVRVVTAPASAAEAGDHLRGLLTDDRRAHRGVLTDASIRGGARVGGCEIGA